ncbi:flagellin [Rhizobium sp. Root1212]|uniref:flagellin n=1 Tax=Rhizobium sp. Root1212 TaxID=1736429 RepID=UPI0006FE0A55|nr:flagellin [Rhizobium sp. Root1212]KQV43887.1 hypothetical protein ASC86_03575 [Rhizobium sp. Root1212]
MTSILTNSAAMAALSTLRSINDGMETTQGRVSSGLRVETASDNAAYWSIATTMQDATKGQLTMDQTVDIDDGAGGTTTADYHLLEVGSPTTTASGVLVELTSTTTDDEVEGMISAVDKMLTNLTDAAATLGATNKRISMQDDFMADLMDVIDKGVGRLVDADMNEESTRLKALQTQQQLGIQALSIANSNSENILSLFR